ncbi:MAG: hypothetical protein B7Z16_10680 [Algoriphagus sp. 32-45-6]|nr:MAG: hypothetical protein B7Z16_10680 [Algoriphagus sp. 32-45-6]
MNTHLKNKRMKTIYFSLLALIVVFYPAYGQERPEGIKTVIGAWSIDMAIQEVAISKNVGKKADTLPQEMKESLDQVLRSKIYMFSEDGAVRISWTSHGVEMIVNGEYELIENQILSIAIDDRKITYRISSDGDRLILIPEEITKGMIERVYLKRFGS